MASQANAKKRMRYNPEQMTRAISAVRSGAMSRKLASKTFGVPRTTLLDKLDGRSPEVSGPVGRRPVLTAGEENTLLCYANLMEEIGYPMTKVEFLKEVKYVLDIDGRNTPFKDNLPGYRWFDSFVKRNPQVCMRKPMGLGQERALVTLEKIQKWYDGLNDFLKKEVPEYERIIKNPRRVFNGDETGFPLSVKPDRVLATKGSKNVYQVVTNNKTQITVMAACNAVGDFAPPMILFAGERLRDVGLSGFPDAIYATTKNGWMDKETFVAYLEKLVDYAKDQSIEFPILLFVDGHSTHMSLQAAEYCHKNDVILYCLVPNATHVMQPLDIGFFSPMKSVWKQTVKHWQIENMGIALSKKDFPRLLKQTWEKVATFENASHGFRKAGLFPLTIDGIDTSKLGPSKMASAINEPRQPATESSTEADTVEKDVDVIEENGLTNGREPAACANTQKAKEQEEESSSGQTLSEEASTSASVPSCSENISPAFSKLRVPQPKQKKSVVRITESLPKAISGAKALQMLKEREEKKKAEEMAKETRKKERLQKKILKEAEAERKRAEREERKKQKQAKHKTTDGKKKGKAKRKHESSDSESEYNSSAYIVDDASSDIDEEFESCPGCSKFDQHPDRWVKCTACHTRWHFMCANRPEYDLLDADERKKMPFVCPLCD